MKNYVFFWDTPPNVALIQADKLLDTIFSQLKIVPWVATKNIIGTQPILKLFPLALPKIMFNIKAMNLYGVWRVDVSYSPEGLVQKFLPGIIIFLSISTISIFISFNQLSIK